MRKCVKKRKPSVIDLKALLIVSIFDLLFYKEGTSLSWQQGLSNQGQLSVNFTISLCFVFAISCFVLKILFIT